MFDPWQKPIGTTYTTTAALLAVAFLFSPSVLLITPPVGYVSLSLAITCSALCVTLAWIHWMKSSELSILSIVTRGERGE